LEGVSLEEGRALAEVGAFRKYDVIRDTPALFWAFAELSPTPDAIKAFADRYGLAFKPVERYWSLGEWKNEIADMNAAVRLWRALLDQDPDGLKEHVAWTRAGLEWLGPLADCSVYLRDKSYRAGDILFPARDLLDQTFSLKATAGIKVIPGRLPNGALDIQLQVEMLADALWLQFAMAVAENKQFRRCQWEPCGRMLAVSPDRPGKGRRGRSDRQFCSDSCRVKAYLRRRETAIEMRSKGAKLREIAKAVDVDMKKLKDWLKED
jgi:hypothetical protein